MRTSRVPNFEELFLPIQHYLAQPTLVESDELRIAKEAYNEIIAIIYGPDPSVIGGCGHGPVKFLTFSK